MNKILLALTMILTGSSIHAVEVIDTADGPKFPKYTFKGTPVFDDAQKQAILDAVAKDSDFIPVVDYPSKDEITLSTSVAALTPLNADGVKRLLTSKTDIEMHVINFGTTLNNLKVSEASSGVDFTAKKNPYISVIEFLKRKYAALP